MTHVEVFTAVVVLLAVQAAWRGGAPERLASLAMLLATGATMLANAGAALPFRHVEWPLLAIDGVLFAVLVVIAVLANRFWPLWLAGFQCVAVAAHTARGFDPQILPVAYWWIVGKLSYPMLALLCIGIERHHRRALDGSREAPWSRTASVEQDVPVSK